MSRPVAAGVAHLLGGAAAERFGPVNPAGFRSTADAGVPLQRNAWEKLPK
jgi:hypothetical protein